MRKLISFLFVSVLTVCSVSVSYAYPDPTFETWTNKSQDAGKHGNAVRVLKLVRYASSDPSSPSLLSGDAVIYSIISDDGVTIAPTALTCDGAIAGIIASTIQSADGTSAIAQDDATRRNWGWLVVHGPATANVNAGGTNAHAVGDPFYTSRDAYRITTLEATLLSGEGAAVAGVKADNTRNLKNAANRGGFFMDAADASATRVDVFVNLE